MFVQDLCSTYLTQEACPIVDRAEYAAPTRQRELDHTDHTDHTDHADHTDHTDHSDHIDQGPICSAW